MMSKGGAGKAARWIVSKVTGDDLGVFEEVSDDFVLIRRSDGSTVGLAVVDVPRLSGEDVLELLTMYPELKVILNSAKPAVIDGSAYRAAEVNHLAVGGWGDVMQALVLKDPSELEEREIGYVLGALRTHSRVTGIERLDNLRFRVSVDSNQSVDILICADYEPTAAAIQIGLSVFGPFDVFVHTSPNGNGPSPECVDLASMHDIQVANVKELFGLLARL